MDEIKLLFTKAGFKKIDILGDGLLMGLILEGNRKVTKTIKKEPELFFEIERKLVRFVDPRKTYTVIVKATAP